MAKRPPRDPLAPIEAVVGIGWYFMLALLILMSGFGIAAAAGGGNAEVSIASFGTDDACVTVDNGSHGVMVHDPSRKSMTYSTRMDPEGVHGDVATVRPETVTLCIDNPTFLHRIAASAGPFGEFALVLGFAFFTRRVVIRARYGRPISAMTADGIQRIGWFLMVGSILVGLISSWGQGVITAAAVDEATVMGAMWLPDVSLLVFTAGVAAISIARVLRWAVVLQEEADVTV